MRRPKAITVRLTVAEAKVLKQCAACFKSDVSENWPRAYRATYLRAVEKLRAAIAETAP